MGEARIAPRRPDISPAADRPPLESFYAKVTSNPLSDAFPGKRAVHPFVGMAPVPETEVEGGLWTQIHQTPRSNRAVAYVHVPFCENHCLFCGFYQNAWRKDSGGPFVDAVIAQLQAFARQPAIEGPPLQAIYLGGGHTHSACRARPCAVDHRLAALFAADAGLRDYAGRAGLVV